jgi:hypothetical protein
MRVSKHEIERLNAQLDELQARVAQSQDTDEYARRLEDKCRAFQEQLLAAA